MSDRNHSTPVSAVHRPDKEDLWNSETPGSYRINPRGDHILCICPCGCGTFMNLPIKTGPKIPGAWQWDGNRESPTLAPSIRDLSGCKFHGFLQAGVWTFTSDSGQGAER